jgi:GNAT superfamily N-acetyltransferase
VTSQLPGNEVAVRPATESDCDAIAAVHGHSWQAGYAHLFSAEFLDGLETTIEERSAFWRNYLTSGRQGQVLVVATVGGEVIGFASFGPARLHRYHDDDGTEQVPNPDEGRGEGYAMYVEPSYWGYGAGTAMMEAVLSGLAEQGYRQAVLWVLEDNPRARSLYEKYGWRADGRSDLFERGGAVTTEISMIKDL